MNNAMNSQKDYRPLSRDEVIRVIEGTGAARRVPMVFNPWIDPNRFGEQKELFSALINKYPCDAEIITLQTPEVFDAPADAPSYRWMNIDSSFPEGTALDAVTAISDWDQLDAVLADFPDPYYINLIPQDVPPKGDVYRVCVWWFCWSWTSPLLI